MARTQAEPYGLGVPGQGTEFTTSHKGPGLITRYMPHLYRFFNWTHGWVEKAGVKNKVMSYLVTLFLLLWAGSTTLYWANWLVNQADSAVVLWVVEGNPFVASQPNPVETRVKMTAPPAPSQAALPTVQASASSQAAPASSGVSAIAQGATGETILKNDGVQKAPANSGSSKAPSAKKVNAAPSVKASNTKQGDSVGKVITDTAKDVSSAESAVEDSVKKGEGVKSLLGF